MNLLTREIEQKISSKAITHTHHTQLQRIVTHTVVILPLYQQTKLILQYRQEQAMLEQNLKLFCNNLVHNKFPTHLAHSCEILILPGTQNHSLVLRFISQAAQ